MPLVRKYPLPTFLEGLVTVSKYDKWLTCKADTLRKRDLGRKRPFAESFSTADYKVKIHGAIVANGEKDPYTGEVLRWDLIGTWNNKIEAFLCSGEARDVFDKELYLLPTVDHCDPYGDTLEFEICSWIVNSSKTLMNPREYVELCKKVAGRAGARRAFGASFESAYV